MKLENIDTRIKSFPSMPGIAMKMLALLDEPQTSLSQIEELLGCDPGLTANLLKLANSAYFGMPSKVGSVRQAVTLLGTKRLVQLVIACCVGAIMDKPLPGYGLSAGELWRHSIAVSVAAQGLVGELQAEAGEEIFTAALLHDVGKLVLSEFVHEDYARIEAAVSEGLSFEAAENLVLGTDHAAVGAQILGRWSVPTNITHAVRWHHRPDATETAGAMLEVVHAANMLCLMIGIGGGRSEQPVPASTAVAGRLGLKQVQLEKVAGQTLQWVEEIAAASGSRRTPGLTN